MITSWKEDDKFCVRQNKENKKKKKKNPENSSYIVFFFIGGSVCRIGDRWVVNPSGGLESKGEVIYQWSLVKYIIKLNVTW